MKEVLFAAKNTGYSNKYCRRLAVKIQNKH
jgi:hypothetical protein